VSDPDDKTDRHRDNALNILIETIEDTGGLITTWPDGKDGEAVLVPKHAEWILLADAYLEACEAMRVQPLIDGERAPKILKITVQVARSAKDYISNAENDTETSLLHGLFKDLSEDLEVAVVDCDGVYLYDAHREV
jgi:N-acetylglutamate synthase/N-acetylornithine aminotransferase